MNNKRPESMQRITTPELAQAFIEEQLTALRAQIGDKNVLLALSGGVDSSVVAALLIKAVGKQLVCVLIHQKQDLADPTELLYSIAKLEPLAQLPDPLPDDLHHQHVGTAGPAQGKRFLRP